MADMNLLEVLVYLDDLIVFGKTLEEHEQRLLRVLDRLKEEGLKLLLDKCQFCCPSVTYFGHIVSSNGIATDPSKIKAVKSWPCPENITALRSFLGFCGHYRRFVKDFLPESAIYSTSCCRAAVLLEGQGQRQRLKKWEREQKQRTGKRNQCVVSPLRAFWIQVG